MQTHDGSGGVIRPKSAASQRAGQNELFGRGTVAVFDAIAVVEGKEYVGLTFHAANGEIPASVGFGPTRNFHEVNPALMALYLSSLIIIFLT